MRSTEDNVAGGQPAPTMVYRELVVTGKAGPELAYRGWRPAQAPPRAVVLIVPGFKSHSGRYAWAGEQLAKAGLAVYALDLRGRGKSRGRAYAVVDFDEYVDDVETVAAAVQTKEAGLPLFVVGHSAGAVVALLYTLRHEHYISGVVAMSIAQELPAPGFALSAFKVLSKIVPHAPILRLRSDEFTRDQGVLASMNADPMIAGETEPLQTVAALVRAGERLQMEIAQLNVPVLFMHGSGDHAARPSGSKHLYESAGSLDKQLVIYDDVRHEPLADLGRERVLGDLLKWLDNHARKANTVGRSAPGGGDSNRKAVLGAGQVS
jgi:acylglycerol lipase